MSAGTPEDRLLAAMLECGLSETRARVRAADFAAIIGPELDRERRERVIRDLLPRLTAEEIADRMGVCRATVYNIAGRKSKFSRVA